MIVSAIIGATLAELALRAWGYDQLPLYRPDSSLGYVPRADTSGTFAGARRWAFNSQGMRMDGECPTDRDAILLLGDSLVHGGTMVSQENTLGAHLALASGRPVCPLGAGSWALENELQAVLHNPRLLRFSTIILVSNSEDFVAPSVWKSEIDHPTERPASILLTAVGKKLSALLASVRPRPKPVNDRRWESSLERFLGTYRG